MKLSLIIENNQILQQTAEKLGLELDYLNKLVTDADPTGRKYRLFILKLLNKNNIRLPEDNYRVKEALNNFIKYQRNLVIKDILKYDSLHGLETALEPFLGSISKRQGGNNINPFGLPGVKLLIDKGNIKTYQISDVESLKDMGEGTKWCTRRSYPDCQAEHYIEQYNWIGVIYKDGKPFIQFTPDYSQVMDVNDEGFEDCDNYDFAFPEPDINIENIDTILTYAINIIKRRWPEVEPIIMTDPYYIYRYACDVIKHRWPEAEPIILTDPVYSTSYSCYVVKGRWPEAENMLLDYPIEALKYAEFVIKDRWVPAENNFVNNINKIMSSDSVTDALSAIICYSISSLREYGRWVQVERAVLSWIYSNENHELAGIASKFICDYCLLVIRGRWFAAEKYVLANAFSACQYACYVIKDRWPEAESIISKKRPVNIHQYNKLFGTNL